MVPNQTGRTIAFRRAYGKAAPPEKVTQEAFEGNDRHLRRLLRIKPGERPDLQDLWELARSPLYRHPKLASRIPASFLSGTLVLGSTRN